MRIANCMVAGALRTAIDRPRGIELLPVGSGNALTVALEAGASPRGEGEPVDEADIAFLPPVVPSGKLLCVGVNYREHAFEAAAAAAEYPALFVRFWDSIVPHRAPIIAPANSERFDFEGELAIIIGREARHVPEADALDHIAGYSCFADNSVRDFQSHSRQATAGKNFPHSGAIGPWLATADEIDPAGLTLTTRLNGEIVQQAPTADMMFGAGALVSYVSRFTLLRPGDVIAMGTPSGIGALRQPPLWMKPGDTLEVEIPGVGHLVNPVAPEIGA